MALVDETLFGKYDKVQIAIDRIKQYEPPEGYYVAFSGGKDSCVVLDLVKRAGVKYDAHYNLTTVDPPELVYFIREHHADVEVHKPKKTMWQLIEKNGGPPTMLQRYCCRILKEGGGIGRTVITGVRWEESARRRQRKMYEKDRKQKKTYLHPIIDWNEADIWNYIYQNSLPYCSLYDEDWVDRIGCIMCPMASPSRMKKEAERWPTYEKMYRLAIKKAYEKRKAKGKKMDWKSGDDMFEWWISKKAPTKTDKNQTTMFE